MHGVSMLREPGVGAPYMWTAMHAGESCPCMESSMLRVPGMRGPCM